LPPGGGCTRMRQAGACVWSGPVRELLGASIRPGRRHGGPANTGRQRREEPLRWSARNPQYHRERCVPAGQSTRPTGQRYAAAELPKGCRDEFRNRAPLAVSLRSPQSVSLSSYPENVTGEDFGFPARASGKYREKADWGRSGGCGHQPRFRFRVWRHWFFIALRTAPGWGQRYDYSPPRAEQAILDADGGKRSDANPRSGRH
jgi:hypothetical protein